MFNIWSDITDPKSRFGIGVFERESNQLSVVLKVLHFYRVLKKNHAL